MELKSKWEALTIISKVYLELLSLHVPFKDDLQEHEYLT